MENAQAKKLAEDWISGKITIQEMMDLSGEELYAISSFGYLLFMQGKFEDARIIFEGLISISPRQAYYYRALGSVYWKLKEPERAIQQFNHAIKVEPADLSTYISRAEVYVGSKEFKSAKKDLLRVLRQGSEAQSALLNKARAILSMLPQVRN